MSDAPPHNPKQDPNPPSNTAKDPDDWVTGDEPMTGAQASYLKTLSEEAHDDKAFADDLRSEEHTSELQSRQYLVCRLLLEKKKKKDDPSSRSDESTQTATVVPPPTWSHIKIH